MPAEMSIALSRAHLHPRMHVASCWRRVHHRDRHQHTIPIALAALQGAILPATSCIGAFRTPAPQRVDSLVMPASENLHTSGLMHRRKMVAYSMLSSARASNVAGISM